MSSTGETSPQPRFQAFQTMAGPIIREQTVEERYGIPENFLEIEVKNPQTHGKVCFLLSPLFIFLFLNKNKNKNKKEKVYNN